MSDTSNRYARTDLQRGRKISADPHASFFLLRHPVQGAACEEAEWAGGAVSAAFQWHSPASFYFSAVL
jgi:hypothetical protein